MNKLLNASIGLGHLRQEPSRLRAEAERLNEELGSLVLDNYRVFVRNLSVSNHLRKEGEKLKKVSEQMGSTVHELEEECSHLRNRIDPLLGSFRRNKKTLRFQMELIELLEVPQLVDACARNGLHDEALELANFVNTLERRNQLASEIRAEQAGSKGLSVIRSIVEEVHSTIHSLRDILQTQLRNNESVAQHLSTLAVLRKLDVFLIDRELAGSLAALGNEGQRESQRADMLRSAETRLQMGFLEARTQWMLQLAEASKDRSDLGPYGRAIDLLEKKRTAWFAITTQFNALFEDSGGMCPAASVLSGWVTNQIDGLLRQLRLYVLQIEDGVSLRSVIEQTLLFSSRMGQIGCDFSSLVIPLFEECIITRQNEYLRLTMENFRTILKSEKMALRDEHNNIVAEQLIPIYSIQDNADVDVEMNVSVVEAPSALLRFPPLGFLLNSLLSTLNYVRECPLRNLRPEISLLIQNCLRAAVDAIIHERTVVRSKGVTYLGNDGERLDDLFLKAMESSLAPHALRALDMIYAVIGKEVSNEPSSWSYETQNFYQDLQQTILAN